MCRTESQAKEALRRIGLVMNRLGLTLHPEKTRMVDLRRGKGEFRVSGVYDPQEAQYLAEPAQAFHAAVAVAEGHETAPGPCARVDRCAAQREGCEADYRGTESRTSWLGQLLSDGECRSGVHQDGRLRVPALHRWQYRRGGQRPTRRSSMDPPQLYGMGLYRLQGTVRYPAQATSIRSSLSCVRENRTHGLKGG